MSLPQKKFREIVVQMLYSHDLSAASSEEMIPFMMQEQSVTKANMRAAQSRMEQVLGRKEELDTLIAKWSVGYAIERIHRVERNILRLAFFELFDDPAIPPKVAITEAMRLARKFSSPEGAHFVNAILDAAYQDHLAMNAEEEEDKEKIFFEGEEERKGGGPHKLP